MLAAAAASGVSGVIGLKCGASKAASRRTGVLKCMKEKRLEGSNSEMRYQAKRSASNAE